MSGVLDHDEDLYSVQAAPHRLNDLSCAHDRKTMFDRDGFLVIRRLASPETCTRLLQTVHGELNEPSGSIEYEADLGYAGAG